MKPNLGPVDRFFRIAIGIVGMVAGYMNQSVAWDVIGLAVIATGVIAYCPVYDLLGLRDSRQ